MSHYLKLVMDAVFGRGSFRNEIVWHYAKWSNVANSFQSNHDVILFYAQTKGATFNKQYLISDDKKKKLARGYQINVAAGKRQLIYYDEKMVTQVDPARYDVLVDRTKANPGNAMPDVWSDINILNSQAKERTGFPTQKPLALLDRIIKGSSQKGDVVFDPFCGCATTLVSADRLERRWVGIDISELAAKLVRERIEKDQGMFPNLIARTDIPRRNDLGDLPPYNSPKVKDALYGEQGGDCNGCRTHFQKQHLTVDHIIAQSKGGTDHLENLQLLCGHCNSIKGDRGQEYLLAKLAV